MEYDKIVPRGTLEQIENLIELIFKFNKAYRLIGVKDKKIFLDHHVIPVLELKKVFTETKIFDIGSGNGIPGLILSIIGFSVTLIEIDRNKSYILKEIIKDLDLEVNVANTDYKGVYYDQCAVVSKGLLNAEDSIELMKNNKNISEVILIKGKKAFDEKKHFVKNDFKASIIPSTIYNETNFLKITRI